MPFAPIAERRDAPGHPTRMTRLRNFASQPEWLFCRRPKLQVDAPE